MHRVVNFKDRQLIASTLLAGFLAAGCCCLHHGHPGETKARAQAQIQERLQEILTAAETKDFVRLDSYHWYGPQFSKFSGASAERADAAVARKGEHDGLGAAQNLKMKAEEVKIDLFGNVGIATFILNYSFDSKGEVVRRKERSTLVFVKDGGDWKITHEHLSRIGP